MAYSRRTSLMSSGRNLTNLGFLYNNPTQTFEA